MHNSTPFCVTLASNPGNDALQLSTLHTLVFKLIVKMARILQRHFYTYESRLMYAHENKSLMARHEGVELIHAYIASCRAC